MNEISGPLITFAGIAGAGLMLALLASCGGGDDSPPATAPGATDDERNQITVEQWQPIVEDRWSYLSKNAVYSEVSTKEIVIDEEGMTPTGEPVGWVKYLSEASALHFLAHGELGPKEERANWLRVLPKGAPIKGLLLMPAFSSGREPLDALRIEWVYERQEGTVVHHPQEVKVIESGLIPIIMQGFYDIEFGHIASSHLVYRDRESGEAVAGVFRVWPRLNNEEEDKQEGTVWVHPGYDIQFMYHVADNSGRVYFYESDIVSTEEEGGPAVVVFNQIKIIPRKEVAFIYKGDRIQFQEGETVRLRDRQEYISYDRITKGFRKNVHTQGSNAHFMLVQHEADTLQVPFKHKRMLYPARLRLPSHIAAISNPVWTGIEVYGVNPQVFYDLKEPWPWSEIEAATDEPIKIELINKEVLQIR